jgi:hypothetical protein
VNIPVTRRLRAVLDNITRSATSFRLARWHPVALGVANIPEDLLTVMPLHCMLSVMRDAKAAPSLNSTLTVYL